MDRSVQINGRKFQMGTGSWKYRFGVDANHRPRPADQASVGTGIEGEQALTRVRRTTAETHRTRSSRRPSSFLPWHRG